jgi:DNA-binding CsgD family transcriptional regulator
MMISGLKRQEIANVYLAGASITQVAQITGISRGAVQRALKALGIPRRKGCGRPRKHPLSRIAELHATGATQAEIGEQLGIHHTTVGYALGKLGVPSNKRGRRQNRGNWTNYASYREEWRAKNGLKPLCPVERMVQVAFQERISA